jgi:uncharacterized protein
MAEPTRTVFVLIDGENLDSTLGNSILRHRPEPGERPRWERLWDYVRDNWGGDVRPLFFLNAANLQLPSAFVQALVTMRYRPVLLSGPSDAKVVDMAILRTLEAIAAQEGAADVILASHDQDFIPRLNPLIGGERRVGLLGFPELFNSKYNDLRAQGLEFIDLELDVQAFNRKLPRMLVIPIDEFDPTQFMGPA